MEERLTIVGSGAIACGVAAVAARHGKLALYARSDKSADGARDKIHRMCSSLDGDVNPGHVEITTDLAAALEGSTYVVEAIVEDLALKSPVLAEIAKSVDANTIIASTTSSLSVEELASATGQAERFAGLHVFNPVTKMRLVELAFPTAATEDTKERTHALCDALGKTAVEVGDTPGFVVNRLLFPYLFDAVKLMEETGLVASDIDTCMKLGAGHPMGPLALLDLVGLDVSKAIGETIGTAIPATVDKLIDEGALGRKTGRGFHTYG